MTESSSAYRTVVVGTDGSESSLRAVARAGAVGAQEAGHGPGFDGEPQVGDGTYLAERLAESAHLDPDGVDRRGAGDGNDVSSDGPRGAAPSKRTRGCSRDPPVGLGAPSACAMGGMISA